MNVVDTNPVVNTVQQTAEEAQAASFCCYIKDRSKIIRLFFFITSDICMQDSQHLTIIGEIATKLQ